MGGSLSQPRSELRTEIISEFVKYVYQHPQNPTISLKQLLEGSKRVSVSYDLAHLPLLYFIDEDKDGRFSLADIFNIQSFQLQIDHTDAAKALKAHSTLYLRRNPLDFVKWFGQLAIEINGEKLQNSVRTINENAVLVLYDLLQVQITRLSTEEFISNLQTAAQQIGLTQTVGIPILVIQNFAQSILNGLVNLYKEILNEDVNQSFQRAFKFEQLKEEYFEQIGKCVEEDDE
ncbi:hypothetical protein SS50377_23298 [Spironucleus salmonicida]|uniref:Uncharacterized protein n=1 Tax=Spironucleus salmonicida TaxID=348837 RepID=V6LU13_9EUKA|nr:hypothetical protein SS50377_23298 [Spironucleus salmonicida]|eukprot:EST47166.1 Hypothetical protein SS50377_12677 [Spironucleus salmonicida]